MFKSASSNHSLWPEQARPRKTKQQLALVIGAACIGAVAAISAHNVLTDLSTPAQEPVQQSSLAAPIFATPSPASAESAVAASASLAAAKLLSASTAPAIPSSATDGRGGATAARSGETLATGAAIAATASAPVKATETAKPAAGPPANTAEIAQPGMDPTAQPTEAAAKPATPERPKTVRKKRDPNYYARNRNEQIFPFFGFMNGFGRRG